MKRIPPIRYTPWGMFTILACLIVLLDMVYVWIWPEICAFYMMRRAAPLTERGAALYLGRWWAFRPQRPQNTTDKVVESWLPYLRQLGVKELSLRDSRISDQALSKLTTLQCLVRLDVANTSIDDSGLAAISELRNVRTLDLSGTRITDKGLSYLGDMPRLCRVTIERTQVSQRARVDFAKRHPSVYVYPITEMHE